MLARSEQVVEDVNGTANSTVQSGVLNAGVQIDGVQASISSIGELTDPNYGLLAGLNCLLFGEDFERFQQVLCGKTYVTVYDHRIIIAIISFALLFSLCCLTCTGVRQYKQEQMMENEKKYLGTAQPESEEKIVIELVE